MRPAYSLSRRYEHQVFQLHSVGFFSGIRLSWTIDDTNDVMVQVSEGGLVYIGFSYLQSGGEYYAGFQSWSELITSKSALHDPPCHINDELLSIALEKMKGISCSVEISITNQSNLTIHSIYLQINDEPRTISPLINVAADTTKTLYTAGLPIGNYVIELLCTISTNKKSEKLRQRQSVFIDKKTCINFILTDQLLLTYQIPSPW